MDSCPAAWPAAGAGSANCSLRKHGRDDSCSGSGSALKVDQEGAARYLRVRVQLEEQDAQQQANVADVADMDGLAETVDLKEISDSMAKTSKKRAVLGLINMGVALCS